MATGSILLTPGSAILPDGSSNNLAPQISRVKSSATPPGIYFLQLDFDSSQEEWCCWQFRCPVDYASNPIARVQYRIGTTTGGVAWDVRVSATSDGDAQDITTQDFGSANVGTATVPGTVRYLDEVSVTLTNADSLAAGDFVVLRVARAVANGADTAASDAALLAVNFEYVTV